MFEPLAQAIRSRRGRRPPVRSPLATPALHRRRQGILDEEETALVVARVPVRSRDRAREFVERLRIVPETEQEAVAATLSVLAEIGTAGTDGLPRPGSKRHVPPTG